MTDHLPDAVLFCTCPRCHGVRWVSIPEYVTAHRDLNLLLDSEVRIEVPPQADPPDNCWQYTGELDGGQVLLTLWPSDDCAELATRPNQWQTWGPPIELEPVVWSSNTAS